MFEEYSSIMQKVIKDVSFDVLDRRNYNKVRTMIRSLITKGGMTHEEIIAKVKKEFKLN